MNQDTSVDHTDIVFFLDVLVSYCVFYFGENEGNALYNDYCRYHADIIPAIKHENHTGGEKLFKLRLILTKIKTDVYFNKIGIYHVKWPYDQGEIKGIDFELFALTCHNFYEALGESQGAREERVKLGFHKKILCLLLPPQNDLLFNHSERSNKNLMLLERLYGELKSRNPEILKTYGKNFWQLTKSEFDAYIHQRIQKTPQQLTTSLWYHIRED